MTMEFEILASDAVGIPAYLAQLTRWLPAGLLRQARKRTFLGGLYQTLVLTR